MIPGSWEVIVFLESMFCLINLLRLVVKMNFKYLQSLKMDTCIWVIGVGILELYRGSVGLNCYDQSGLNSPGARPNGTDVLSTCSVISNNVWDPDSLYNEESSTPMTRLDVQGKHVRVHDESTMGIRKDVLYKSRVLGNKYKYGIDMSGGKPNQ
jgi:hypothetical protein